MSSGIKGNICIRLVRSYAKEFATQSIPDRIRGCESKRLIMIKCIPSLPKREMQGFSSFIIIYSYPRPWINVCMYVYAFLLDIGISDARNISLKIIGVRANISRLQFDIPCLLGTYGYRFVRTCAHRQLLVHFYCPNCWSGMEVQQDRMRKSVLQSAGVQY